MAHTELDLRERRAIEDMLHAKVPVSKIATEIGRQQRTGISPLAVPNSSRPKFPHPPVASDP